MLLWILIGVAAVALAVYAFWPRRRGVSDKAALDARRRDQGDVENYDNPGFGPL